MDQCTNATVLYYSACDEENTFSTPLKKTPLPRNNRCTDFHPTKAELVPECVCASNGTLDCTYCDTSCIRQQRQQCCMISTQALIYLINTMHLIALELFWW